MILSRISVQCCMHLEMIHVKKVSPLWQLIRQSEHDTSHAKHLIIAIFEKPSHGVTRLAHCFWHVDVPGKMRENYRGEQPQPRPLVFSKYHEVIVISDHCLWQMRRVWEKWIHIPQHVNTLATGICRSFQTVEDTFRLLDILPMSVRGRILFFSAATWL